MPVVTHEMLLRLITPPLHFADDAERTRARLITLGLWLVLGLGWCVTLYLTAVSGWRTSLLIWLGIQAIPLILLRTRLHMLARYGAVALAVGHPLLLFFAGSAPPSASDFILASVASVGLAYLLLPARHSITVGLFNLVMIITLAPFLPISPDGYLVFFIGAILTNLIAVGVVVAVQLERQSRETQFHKQLALSNENALAQQRLANALREITQLIYSDAALTEVLEAIMSAAQQVVPVFDAATFYVLSADKQSLVYAAQIGYANHEIPLLKQTTFAVNRPKYLWMMENRQWRITDDVRQDPDWIVSDASLWLRSWMGVPIFFRDAFMGILSLDARQPHAFKQEYGDHMMALAQQAGIAIANSQQARQLAEQAREASTQMSAVLEASAEGIAYSDGETIRFANRALEGLLGLEMGASKGLPSFCLWQTGDPAEDTLFIQRLHEAIRRDGLWRGERALLRPDGTHVEVALTVSPLEAEGGERWVWLMRDIGAEKAQERFKSRFIAAAAHELRSPITSLNTRLYLMRRSPQALDEHVAALERTISHVNRLVADMLDLSYLEHGRIPLRKRSIVLQDVVSESVGNSALEAEKKAILIRYQAPETPIVLWADPHRLIQVLANIIGNAIHYSEAQQAIGVTLERREDSAYIIIRDHGPGIPAEALPHLFEPFYRVNKQSEKRGSGLGLSIAHEIVQQHWGQIAVESHLGAGSTFTVILPLSDAESDVPSTIAQ